MICFRPHRKWRHRQWRHFGVISDERAITILILRFAVARFDRGVTSCCYLIIAPCCASLFLPTLKIFNRRTVVTCVVLWFICAKSVQLRTTQHDRDSRYYRYDRIRNGRFTNDVIFSFVVIYSVAFKNRNNNNNDDNKFNSLFSQQATTNKCMH